MREDEAVNLLRAYLDCSGVPWVRESGWLRFRCRRDGMIWETACRGTENGILFYSRFPFVPRDPEGARRVCGEANRSLTRGALFLGEDGSPVYRCRAETDDVFLAENRIAAALDYSAGVMAHFWGRLAGAPSSEKSFDAMISEPIYLP